MFKRIGLLYSQVRSRIFDRRHLRSGRTTSNRSLFSENRSQHPGQLEFIQSMPGPDESLLISDGSVRLLLVELYDRAVIVDWLVSRRDPNRNFVSQPRLGGSTQDRIAAFLRISTEGTPMALRDDVGTAYSGPMPEAVTAPSQVHFGRTLFTPALPGDAEILFVEWGSAGALEVAVPRRQPEKP